MKRKLLLRFNGVDHDFIVPNTDRGTERKNAYFRQEPIPGLGSATRLTVGCLPTPARSEVQAIVLSCQVSNLPVPPEPLKPLRFQVVRYFE